MWFRNEMLIAEDVNTTTITDAEDGDFISCRAINDVGNDYEHTTINVTTGNFAMKTMLRTYSTKCCINILTDCKAVHIKF